MKKQAKKRLAVLFASAGIAFTAAFCPTATLCTQAAILPPDVIVSPLHDDLQWVFKVENGKIYRRLYNYSTANWVTPWLYVGEYPGDK